MGGLDKGIAGFTGEERWTGVEFAEEMGFIADASTLSTGQEFWLNVGMDILFDPLSYATLGKKAVVKLLGLGDDAGRATYKVVRAASKADDVGRVLKRGNLFTVIQQKTGLKKFWKTTSPEDLIGIIDDINKDLIAEGKPIFDVVLETTEQTAKTAKRGFRRGAQEVIEVDEVLDAAGNIKKPARTVKVNRRVQMPDDFDFNAPGAMSEVNLANAAADALDQVGAVADGIRIRLSKTANRSIDMIYETVINYRGRNLVMKLANFTVDAKSLVDDAGRVAGAMGWSFVVTGKNGTIQLAKRSGKKLSKVVRDEIDNVFRQISEEAQKQGIKVEQVLELMKKGEWNGAKTGQLKKIFNVSDEAMQTVFDIYEDIIKNSGSTYYSFFDTAGNLVTVKGNDFLDLIDQTVQFGFFSTKGKPQLRMLSTVRLKNGKEIIENGSDEFMRDLLTQVTGDVGASGTNLTLRLLNGPTEAAKKAAQVIQAPVDIATEVVGTLFKDFNPTLKLSKGFINNVARMGGEELFRLRGFQRRAHSLFNKVRKVSKGVLGKRSAGEVLAELAEANVKVIRETVTDPNTGEQVAKITLEAGDRIVQTTRFFDWFKDAVANGRKAQLPLPKGSATRYAQGSKRELAVTAQNMVDRFNDMYRQLYGVDEAFDVIEEGGRYYLQLKNITADALRQADFTQLRKNYQTLNFGHGQMSKEAEELFMQNLDEVEELLSLNYQVADTLRAELGYDAVEEWLTGTAGYVRHTMTTEFKQLAKGRYKAVIEPYLKRGVDLLRDRKFLGAMDEVNDAMRAILNIEVDMFTNDFMAAFDDLVDVSLQMQNRNNVLKLMMDTSLENGKAFFEVVENNLDALKPLGKQFKTFKSFEVEFANITKSLGDETAVLFKDYLKRLGLRDGADQVIAIHQSAYDLLKQLDKSFIDLPAFVKGYDKFLNLWKSITLITPGYHLRNLLGNATNAYLVGMGMPAQLQYAGRAAMDFWRSKKIYSLIDQNISKINPLTNQLYTMDEIASEFLTKGQQQVFTRLKNFYSDGISQSFKGVKDLESVKSALQAGGRKNVLQKIVSMNYDVAERMDDFQRYMLYQWSYNDHYRWAKPWFSKKGFNVGQTVMKSRNAARETVNKALFDYQNLTSFEREYMKRIFPFYTFMKKNLVFQAQNIIQNPGQYGRLGRAYRYYTEGVAGIDLEQMPDYALGNLWIPLPVNFDTASGEQRAFLKANLPAAEFFELIEEGPKKLVTSLAAPIKLPLEIGAGVDFFTGQELQKFPGEQRRMEEGTGVLSGIRGERGELALSGSPLMQKIGNELGLRNAKQYASIIFDIADNIEGYKTEPEAILEVLERLGVTGLKPIKEIQITNLYQDLEDLRNLRYLYEQDSGFKLPTLSDIQGERLGDFARNTRSTLGTFGQ